MSQTAPKTAPKTAPEDTPVADDEQLLHLVFGGEVESLTDVRFRDVAALDLVGIFPDYESAYNAWKSKAQETVDNAHMRYFIVHMHRLLEPEHHG